MEDQFDHEFSYKVNPRALASLADQDTERIAKPTERQPLLTEEDRYLLRDQILTEICDSESGYHESAYDAAHAAGLAVRQACMDGLREKIASGELRMYTPIKRSECKEHCLNNCKDYLADRLDSYFEDNIEFCPGCGNPITE